MPRPACFAFLAALCALAGCDQPALTGGEVAADGLDSAIERLPDAEGTMTDGVAPSPGTAGL